MITSHQINHASRLLKQLLQKPDFAIIGGYHGVNLGDLALGESVRHVLKKMDYNGGLQTIYNLNHWPWPSISYAILGGGAIGYSDSLTKVNNRYKGDFTKVAFLGVDFNEESYPDYLIEMLKKCNYISCRNEFQANKLMQLTGRKDISFYPDLVFSYKRGLCTKLRKDKKAKILLVNIVPLYGSLKDGEMVPNLSYKEERPELYKNYDNLIKHYHDGIRLMVKQHIDEGYAVETVPFTPGDEEIGRLVLQGLKVKHNSYSGNIDKMLLKIGTAQRVFATRYHATILAIKTGAEVIPMAYAVKNEKLLEEFGVERSQYSSSDDLAKSAVSFDKPLIINMEKVPGWEKKAEQGIEQCITSLLRK